MRRSSLDALWRAFVCTPLILLSIGIVDAQVMQSSNYQIQSDSINPGGGLSSSPNYIIESTSGEIATGESNSASYKLKAGYQQMQEVYVALTGATSVSLSPAIPGVTGGTSNGSTTVKVVTDSVAGYQLTIAAENSPALQKGADSIADYAPAGDPDFSFTTAPSDAHFGYSPEGSDVAQRFLDNGATCNTGSGNTSLSCWDGLSTTSEVISSSSNANHPAGATTTIYFRVGIGNSVVQAQGVYTATTTITATAL